MDKFSSKIALFFFFYLPLAQGEGVIVGNVKWNSSGKALTEKQILKKYAFESAVNDDGQNSIYRNGTLKGTEIKVGVKLEDPNNKTLYLPQEVRVYEDLQKKAPNLLVKGFANILDYGILNNKRALLLSRLGLTLVDYIVENDLGYYTWELFRFIGPIVIDEIKFLHDAGYIHQDIKLDNLMFGLEDPRNANSTDQTSFKNRVYMIDLGSATRYRDENGTCYNQTVASKTTMGTEPYYPRTRRHCLSGSRRDDMETFGYVLFTAVGVKLPWEDEADKKKANHTKILEEQEKFCNNLQVGELCKKSGITDKRIHKAILNYFTLLKKLFKDAQGFFKEPNYAAFKKCFDVEAK